MQDVQDVQVQDVRGMCRGPSQHRLKPVPQKHFAYRGSLRRLSTQYAATGKVSVALASAGAEEEILDHIERKPVPIDRCWQR